MKVRPQARPLTGQLLSQSADGNRPGSSIADAVKSRRPRTCARPFGPIDLGRPRPAGGWRSTFLDARTLARTRASGRSRTVATAAAHPAGHGKARPRRGPEMTAPAMTPFLMNRLGPCSAGRWGRRSIRGGTARRGAVGGQPPDHAARQRREKRNRNRPEPLAPDLPPPLGPLEPTTRSCAATLPSLIARSKAATA